MTITASFLGIAGHQHGQFTITYVRGMKCADAQAL